MIFDDVLGQPESQSWACFKFCCEKRFEDSLLQLDRYSCSSIGNRDFQRGTVSRVHRPSHANMQRASGTGHSVYCVCYKVRNRLAEYTS